MTVPQVHMVFIHHNLFITSLLGSKAETVLKYPCNIQTKIYRLYRKMTMVILGTKNRDEREKQTRKRKMNESEGTEEIFVFLYLYLLQG